MAGLAPCVAHFGVGQGEPRVRSGFEVVRLITVALRALFRSDEFRTRNLRRDQHRTIDRHAGDEKQPPGRYPSENQDVSRQTRFGLHGSWYEGGFGLETVGQSGALCYRPSRLF